MRHLRVWNVYFCIIVRALYGCRCRCRQRHHITTNTRSYWVARGGHPKNMPKIFKLMRWHTHGTVFVVVWTTTTTFISVCFAWTEGNVRKIIFIQLTYGAAVIQYDVVAPKVLSTVSVFTGYTTPKEESEKEKNYGKIFIFSQMQNTY